MTFGVGAGVGAGDAGVGVGTGTTCTLLWADTAQPGEQALMKWSPGAALPGTSKLRIARPLSSVALLPSEVTPSHRNSTDPTGKPLAVALMAAPGVPFDGAMTSRGAASTEGAMASDASRASETTHDGKAIRRPRSATRFTPQWAPNPVPTVRLRRVGVGRVPTTAPSPTYPNVPWPATESAVADTIRS